MSTLEILSIASILLILAMALLMMFFPSRDSNELLNGTDDLIEPSLDSEAAVNESETHEIQLPSQGKLSPGISFAGENIGPITQSRPSDAGNPSTNTSYTESGMIKIARIEPTVYFEPSMRAKHEIIVQGIPSVNDAQQSRDIGMSHSPEPKKTHSDRSQAGQHTLLDKRKIAAHISSRVPLISIVGENGLLSEYYIQEYVTYDAILANQIEGEVSNQSAKTYFDGYHHSTTIVMQDFIKQFSPPLSDSQLASRRFEGDYQLDFFDEVLVITLMPRSFWMAFLVLSPSLPGDDDFLDRFVTGGRLTNLFLKLNRKKQSAMFILNEIDRILSHLLVKKVD